MVLYRHDAIKPVKTIQIPDKATDSLYQQSIPDNISTSSDMVSSSSSVSSISSTNETRRIFLVHVGKTGGETLKHALRIGCQVFTNRIKRDACWNKFASHYNNSQTPEPLLSQLVTGYFHYRHMTPPGALNDATHFLFTLRHPLSRIQSWFRYISPLNCIVPKTTHNNRTHANNASSAPDVTNEHRRLVRQKTMSFTCRVRQAYRNTSSPEARFFGCFPTLKVLAQTLPSLTTTTTTTNSSRKTSKKERCIGILRDVLSSDSQHLVFPSELLLGHFVMNYQYYAQNTIVARPAIPLLAVRTEFMWPDLQRLETFLDPSNSKQQQHNAFGRLQGIKVSHRQDALVDHALVNPEASRHLCCLLQQELHIYRTIIQQSINLNDTEKAYSLAQSTEYCHFDSWEDLQMICRPYRDLYTHQRNDS